MGVVLCLATPQFVPGSDVGGGERGRQDKVMAKLSCLDGAAMKSAKAPFSDKSSTVRVQKNSTTCTTKRFNANKNNQPMDE